MSTESKYVLGLDLGITSVGYALVDLDQKKPIIKAGVHLFETAENPKTGASLAAPRREARATRRRLARRRMRLDAVLRTLKKFGFQDVARITETPSPQRLNYNPWQLRSSGLDCKLSDLEFGIAVYHLAKHRGFRSSRLDRSNEDGKEKVGKMLDAMNKLEIALTDRTITIGKYLYDWYTREGYNRNKEGDYLLTPRREWVREELKRLCDKQTELGHPKVTPELYQKLDEVIFFQRPLKSIAGKIGVCSHIVDERRAVKNAFSSELFVFWSKLNNLRICGQTEERPLNKDERNAVFKRALEVEKLTFKQLRKLLQIADDVRINLQRSGDKDTKAIFEFKGYHTLRKAVEEIDPSIWQTLKDDPELLDHIATVLTIHFDETKIADELKTNPALTAADPALIPKLCEIASFKGTISLSLKAINILLPYLTEGKNYTDALKAAIQEGKLLSRASNRASLLPQFEKTNNPVVDRALAQARKVVNAIIREFEREYGLPKIVVLELARDVGKSRKERKQIEKLNKENEDRNNKAKAALEEAGLSQSKDMVDKYKLWVEQDEKCPYSGRKISSADFKGDHVQVDHIIPFSRSFDDSFQNKVLVFTSENQTKGNRTPYEWLTDNEWEEFKDRVELMYSDKNKKKLKKLLIQKVDEDFKDRNLSDTRWISLWFKKHIEEKLEGVKVMCTKGGITYALRRELLPDQPKDRSHHAHHAEDAILVALTSPSLIQRVTQNDQKKLTEADSHRSITILKPWDTFSEDVKQAISEIQVTRMPNRKYTGAATKETIMSYRGKPIEGGAARVFNEPTVNTKGLVINNVVKRVGLANVTSKTLENMVDQHRNQTLYKLLKERLDENADDPKKAFAEPVFMPQKDGTRGPKVTGIRVYDDSVALVPIQKGVANNGDMVRIDVFRSPKGFVVSPIYVMDVLTQQLPTTYVEKSKEHPLNPDWQFQCTLQKNEYVELINTNKKSNERIKTKGFYLGFDRSNGSIKLQDCVEETTNLKTGEVKIARCKDKHKRLGIKTLDDIQKYNLTLLGEKYRVKQKKRQPLHSKKQRGA